MPAKSSLQDVLQGKGRVFLKLVQPRSGVKTESPENEVAI